MLSLRRNTLIPHTTRRMMVIKSRTIIQFMPNSLVVTIAFIGHKIDKFASHRSLFMAQMPFQSPFSPRMPWTAPSESPPRENETPNSKPKPGNT